MRWRVRFGRSSFSVFLTAGVILALSGCGTIGTLFGKGNVLGVEAGDCFDEGAMRTTLVTEEGTGVETVDCSDPHDFEVFHVEELPKGAFPGEVEVGEASRRVCEGERFEAFVGAEYLESEIYSWALAPSATDWDESGHREIVCYLSAPGESVSGSLEGAGR